MLMHVKATIAERTNFILTCYYQTMRCRVWGKVALLVLTGCSSAKGTVEDSHLPVVPTTQADQPRNEDEKPSQSSEEAQAHPAAGLPEGPCQKAVRCEDVQMLMKPYIMVDDRKVCFWEQEARCACAEQLGVDDHEYCDGYY